MVCFKVSLVLLIVLLVERSVGITTTELNVAGQEIKDIVGKDLKDLIKIPDQNFKRGKVYEITILSANYPDVQLSFIASILTIEISNFNIALTARWKIELKVLFAKLKASGGVTLEANGIGIKLTLNIDTLNVISCDDWINELDINFSGNKISGKILSFIARTFKKLVNSRIKKELKGKICKAVRGLINKNRTKISGLLGITLKQITTPKTTRRPPFTPGRLPTCRPSRPGEPRGLCGPWGPIAH